MRLKWIVLGLAVTTGLTLSGFAALVVHSRQAPYPGEQPPPTGICSGCDSPLVLHIWDGVGEEHLVAEFRGAYTARHCDLVVPSRSLWLFKGWECTKCARTWPVSPRILEHRQIPRPSAFERALGSLELWPSSSRRSRFIALGYLVILLVSTGAFLARSQQSPPWKQVGSPWDGIGSRLAAGGVGAAIAFPLYYGVLRLVDANRYWDGNFQTTSEILEGFEIALLGFGVGCLLISMTDPALTRWRRTLLIGVAAGLLGTAAQLMGLVVSGLAATSFLSTFRHQEVVFPAIVIVYLLVFSLSRSFRRGQDTESKSFRRWAYGGLLLCHGLGWVLVRWAVPELP